MADRAPNTGGWRRLAARSRLFAVRCFPFLPALRARLIAAHCLICAPLRWLPGSSLNFGPARRTRAGSILGDPPPGAGIIRLFPERRLIRTLPETASALVREYYSRRTEARTAAGYVVTLRGGRYVGNRWGGSVITSSDCVLDELSSSIAETGAARHYRVVTSLRLPRARRVQSAVVLTGRCADRYYGHWLRDLLPRVGYATLAGIDLRGRCCIINHTDLAFQHETMRALGLDAGRVVRADENTHIWAEELIVPALVIPDNGSQLRGYPAESLEFLRNALGTVSQGAAPGRHVFISRRKTPRSITNEPEVLAALQPLGFEAHVLEDYSVREQVELFQSAAAVVGLHGAGLSNMIFCRPGASIIEIFPPDFIMETFWGLAQQLGLRYGCYCEDGKKRDLPTGRVRAEHSVTLDAGNLARWIEGHLAAADEPARSRRSGA